MIKGVWLKILAKFQLRQAITDLEILAFIFLNPYVANDATTRTILFI